MERTSEFFWKVEKRMLINFIKCMIFTIVAAFIMCLPLGDPEIKCSEKSLDTDDSNVWIICEMHKFLLIVIGKTTVLAKSLNYVLMDALYRAKLQFYAILGAIDREELCRSACGLDEDPSRSKNRESCCTNRKRCKRY